MPDGRPATAARPGHMARTPAASSACTSSRRSRCSASVARRRRRPSTSGCSTASSRCWPRSRFPTASSTPRPATLPRNRRPDADGLAGLGMARRLIALDLDGTMLRRDGLMSPVVRGAVREVAEAGLHVVIATGRGIGTTMPIVSHLGLERGFVVCSNGAVTAELDPDEPKGYRILEVVTFDPGPALEMLRGSWPDAEVAVEEVGVGFKVSGPFPDGELVGEVRVIPVS